MLNRRVIAVIQARMGSTRLPGKIIEKIGGKPQLEILVNRLNKSKHVDDIVIATTKNQNDDVVERLSNEMGINCYRGSEEDVLERYVESSKIFNADVVIRVTGDNPLTDIELLDKLIEAHIENNADYTYCQDTPLGVGAEIIDSNVLREISLKAELDSEREHVTPYIRSHPEQYKIFEFKSNLKNQNIRLTVDTKEDLKLIRTIYRELGDLENLSITEIINFLRKNPELSQINSHVKQKPDNTPNITKIAFLTEGSSEMGMGHVYRSLTFAKELMTNLGAKIYFLTKSSENVIKKIEDENFKTIKLKNDEEIIDYIKKLGLNAVIIDNLDYNENILKKIKNTVKIVIVDNVTSKNNVYADIVINLVGSNFVNKNFFDKNINTQFFCGPKYLMLRDEFDTLRKKKDLKPEIEDILLIFGGSDPSNHTSRVLEKLSSNIRVNIVLGPEFKDFEDLNQTLEKHGNKNVTIHNQPDNVAELMYNADLAITSPGLSMFEAVYLGTPVLVISQNSLQNHYYLPLNFEYLIEKSDIDHLEKYLDDLSSLTTRNDIIKFFREKDIGVGKVEIIKYLSEIIDLKDIY